MNVGRNLPISEERAAELAESHERLVAEIDVCLHDLLEGDIEWLNDEADRQVCGETMTSLSDLVYTVKGGSEGKEKDDGYLRGIVTLEVSACVDAL